MIQNNTYVKTNRSNEQMKDQYTSVPILGPQQIQKLDKLKKIRNNTAKTNDHRNRESIRPSKNWKDPHLQKKHENAHHYKSEIQKQRHSKDKQDSGITKELSYRSNQHHSAKTNRRITRAQHELEDNGPFSKCCEFFKSQNKTSQSPFKTARTIIVKK